MASSHRHLLRALGAAVREDLRDQRLGAVARAHDRVEVALHVRVLLGAALRQLAVAEDRAQDVVEVVRDAAGEVAHRLHLLGLLQLRFELQPILFRAPVKKIHIR